MGSSTRVRLTKMHGAQNDFVLFDARTAALSDLSGFARWACDRRAGIGADGLLVLEGSRTGDVRMRTINTDGSEAEMCGNGIRCAARWLDEAGAGERLAFETAAGTIHTEVIARAPEYRVRVAMGTPRIASFAVPGFSDASFVDLGNPHVVAFCEDPRAMDLEALAERLQGDPRLPDGANVHVVAVENSGVLRVRHWERGVGLTMACGTGAVACAAVAIAQRKVVSPVSVDVPGGRLTVEWDGRGDAFLSGPAIRVFDTEVEFVAHRD
jgi:diaminopimelate epimerase